MEILAAIIMLFLLLRMLVFTVNLATRQWLRRGQPGSTPLVSVLIPARNEEQTLPVLLNVLAQQSYPAFEAWVYNDASTDGTAGVVKEFALNHPFCSLISTDGEPPEGWLGKNHACHVLAQHANGEYLLFLDADVMVESGFLNDMMAHALRYKLDLFSLFPVQIMKSTGEKVLVPMMNRILLSLLPLILTRISRKSSLSAANGQVMLFRAAAYHKHRFHEMVRYSPVEDIRIFRIMKRLRMKTHTMLSGGQVSCRMYHGYEEAINGFSKNVFAFFGGSIAVTCLYALMTTFGWIPVVMAGGMCWFAAWLAGGTLMNVIVSVLSRQPVWTNFLLAIPQQLAFLRLIGSAMLYRIRGGYQWKGRPIQDVKR